VRVSSTIAAVSARPASRLVGRVAMDIARLAPRDRHGLAAGLCNLLIRRSQYRS
jgi:hypothetical protein